MNYDRCRYFTIDDETGRTHQWTDDAIERYLDDLVGDLSEIKDAIDTLASNGLCKGTLIDMAVEARGISNEDAIRRAIAILNGEEV